MIEKRITRDELFMEIAQAFARRSTCPRGSVGVVIVRDRRIIATGYNGAPAKMAHCSEVGCHIDSATFSPDANGRGCTRAVHAEANAIAYAAREGIALEGTTLYTTHSPCVRCAQLIINAGVREVVYNIAYRDQTGLDLLDAASVTFREFRGVDDRA